MRLAIESICYHEERLIPKFIEYYKDKVDEIFVLCSTNPWNGEVDGVDNTPDIARSLGASVIEFDWPNEHSQRNAGLEYLSDCDWVIVLDPDEYISNSDWKALVKFLEDAIFPAYVVEHQRVFYKDKEVYPHTDYKQVIAVKPAVRFVDNRVIDSAWAEAPVDLFHFSWARTDEEILRKITHYGHANQFDGRRWYNEVWLTGQQTNLHPNTPETLKGLIEPELPPELKRLNLWP